MNENILNVEKEINRMKEYVRDVDFCRRKVEEIDAETVMYKSNKIMNIITICTSLFVLLCVILKMREVIIGAGIILAVAATLSILITKARLGYCFSYWLLNLGVILLCAYEFGGLGSGERTYPFLSLVLLMGLQGLTIVCNLKLKKNVNMIAKELDSIE